MHKLLLVELIDLIATYGVEHFILTGVDNAI